MEQSRDEHIWHMWPVRCRCKKPIALYETRYNRLVQGGVSPEEAFEMLGIDNYCCRGSIMNPFPVTVNIANNPDLIAGKAHLNIDTGRSRPFSRATGEDTPLPSGLAARVVKTGAGRLEAPAPSGALAKPRVRIATFGEGGVGQPVVTREYGSSAITARRGPPVVSMDVVPPPEPEMTMQDVGAGYKVPVLSGRSYNAR